MLDNITKIPITTKQRRYNEHGTGFVPDDISGRWLQFEDTYDKESGYVFVDVMTTDENDAPKKICKLCLNIHDLKTELDKITPK